MALTDVFTGAHGTLTLASEDTPEGAAAKAVVDTFAIQTVGRLTDVEVARRHRRSKEFYEVGRRHPVSLSPGDIGISGCVGRAYVNGALLFLLLGRGVSPTAKRNRTCSRRSASTCGSAIRPGRPTRCRSSSGGVKFQNWHYTLPEDEFVMENLRFKALTIRVIDRDGSGAGGGGGGGGGEVPPTNVAFA